MSIGVRALSGVSESVLSGVADALQLDEAERGHLFDLARASGGSSRNRRRPARQSVRPSVQQTLDAMAAVPAYVRNARRDILAANRLGRALYSELYADPARPVNVARFVFLNPRSQHFFLDWQRAAGDTVAFLRTEAGQNPYDRGLTDLIGELSTRSEDFRTRWAAHHVRFHRAGHKDIHHPRRYDIDADQSIVEAVQNTADARGVPMAQVALAWVLRHPVVTAPIVGATKPHHLADAVAALDVHLSDDEVTGLEESYGPHLPSGF